MQIIKRFSFLLLTFVILIPVFLLPVFSYDIIETASGTTSFVIDHWGGTSTLTSDSGPNTARPITSTYQETDSYSEYTNQFYRFVYKTGVKPSALYYAYKITITPTVHRSTFTNIPFYRPCVGTFDQLYKGEGNLAYSFTNSSTIWYVTNSSEENIYFSVYMLCNDINRISKSDSSVSYLRPYYDFDVTWAVTMVPYSYEDYIEAVLHELESQGDDIDLILSYLMNFNTISTDIYNEVEAIYRSNYSQQTAIFSIHNLIRDTIIPHLESIDSSLNTTGSGSDPTYVQDNSSDEFSSVVGSITDGGDAIGSLPDINFDTTTGGFRTFKTFFVYLMQDIPELLTALTLVLTLAFIGYVLGRKLNKGG